ncbi:MAG: hypothetical protein QF535_06425, partial [Anaerolineales bacterium]|nr:hypothetical protein [Anaerolineales bacterium]
MLQSQAKESRSAAHWIYAISNPVSTFTSVIKLQFYGHQLGHLKHLFNPACSNSEASQASLHKPIPVGMDS